MSTELENLVFDEKYRPRIFDDIICIDKFFILEFLTKPLEIPSFIFYSQSPGTGKSSIARIISSYLQTDTLIVNSSDERGIDTIREKIQVFVQTLNSNSKVKKLVIFEEADGLTSAAMKSLKALIEESSKDNFFIFTCNDISKIIEQIRSRCILIDFNSPSKVEITNRLKYICENEHITATPEVIEKLVSELYPDIRSMVLRLQSSRSNDLTLDVQDDTYTTLLSALRLKQAETVYSTAYAHGFSILDFNKWLFRQVFQNYTKFGYENASKITYHLAEIEKAWNMGANLPIVFISHMMQIMRFIN